MFDLRSRAAIAGVTTGAAVLLAVPVVALGQVPGVDQVVGGVNQAAQDVVKAAPAPPVSLPAPAPAPAPKPAPAAPAPAPAASAPAPAAQAPAASAPARSAPATASQGSNGSGGTTHASGKRSRSSGERSGARVHAAAAADKKASGPKASDAQTDTQIADEPASMPRDASPETLPFTGLQLALLVLAGLTAVATGSVVRRAARARS